MSSTSKLQRATTRLVYDLFAYQRTPNDPQPQPATVYTLVRETHEADHKGTVRASRAQQWPIRRQSGLFGIATRRGYAAAERLVST